MLTVHHRPIVLCDASGVIALAPVPSVLVKSLQTGHWKMKHVDTISKIKPEVDKCPGGRQTAACEQERVSKAGERKFRSSCDFNHSMQLID